MKIIFYIVIIAVMGGAGFVLAGIGSGDKAPAVAPRLTSQDSLPDMTARTAIEVVEDCPYGRCPCMTSRIRQTSVPAGWSKLQVKKYSVGRCTAPPAGYHAEKFSDGKCVICPDGMRYSALLQRSDLIRARANLSENQCVLIETVCLK